MIHTMRRVAGYALASSLLCGLPGLAAAYAYVGQAGPPPALPQSNQSSGPAVTWAANQTEVSFTINLDGDYIASALATMAAWNAVNTRLQLRQGFRAAAACNSDGVNTISWRTITCGGEQFDEALAITVVSYRYQRTTGQWEIVDADILLNQGITWSPNRPGPLGGGPTDFYRVLLHEFGHSFGLEHPDEAGETVSAIMNSRLSNLDALQDDDRQGIVFLYGGSVDRPPVSSGGGGGGGGSVWLALLAALGLYRRGRVKRG